MFRLTFRLMFAVFAVVLANDHCLLMSAEPYLAGVAARNVTPDYPVRLNGFAVRKAESEGVSQPVWARALAIQSASAKREDTVVIVTLDNLGIRLSMVDEVARRVHAKSGLPGDRIAFTFTHTHSAPKVNGSSDNIFAEPIPPEHQAHIDRYTSELTDALEAVVLEALQSMKPSSLEWGVGEVGFAMNRRTPGGPTDHSLPVLIVRDAQNQIKAVYTSYACHCVTLSFNQLSGDWAGYAASSIERLIPGCTALVSIGCGSDQNPSSGVTGGQTEVAEQQGLEIASQVERLINNGLHTLTGEIRVTNNRIPLDFTPLPSRQQYEALAAAGGAQGYNAKTQLAKLDRGETLPAALIYPIQTISFGDQLLMVFLGGEVCVDYAIRLRTHLDSGRLWVHGYSNDFGAYIPSERLVAEGGYGGGAEIPYFALPTTLSAGLEQKIVSEVLSQSPDEFNVPEGTQGVAPKSPADSLKCLKTHPELRVELVAAEPLIADPVAIDFGPDGRLWVCQMNDYAHGVEDEFIESSEVRVLTDTDQDGRMDRSDIFVDGLRYPTDVKVWRNGVLICDAPHIYYAEDTNGDNKADIRRILFTGFATHNGQARVNSLQWGLDHWLYASCGLFGGKIRNEHGEIFDVTDRDFRLNPDTGAIEPVTGRTQQSRVRDDWNNWFGCDNSNLIRFYPVEESYSRRNPFVRPAPASAAVMTGENPGRLFPSSDLVLFKLSGPPGIATAACGIGIYRDIILGPEYAGNSFTCEPVNQLIFRQVLTRENVLIQGKRAANEQSSDFLTSTDRWFRPVQARTGPDGGLYIVDMYRYVIEHPRWIPDETLAELNVFAGNDRGRIYRIVPANQPTRRQIALHQLSPPQLAQTIDTPNGVVRDLAHQMLLWNKPTGSQLSKATAALTAVASNSKEPAARLSALCALEGLQSLSSETLLAALEDPHEEVRRHAVRIAERSIDQRVIEAIESRLTDPSPIVRLQVANSLGQMDTPRVGTLIGQVALSSQDPWTTAAALSSINRSNLAEVLQVVLSSPGASSSLKKEVLTTAAGMAEDTAVDQVLTLLLTSKAENDAERIRLTIEFLMGLDRRSSSNTSSSSTSSSNTSTREITDEVRAAGQNLLQSAIKYLRESGNNKDVIASEDQQRTIVASISLLGLPRGPVSRQVLGEAGPDFSTRIADWLSPQIPTTIQEAAVEALSTRGTARDLELLIERLPSSTPSIRTQVVRAILSRKSWYESIVQALEAGQLIPDYFTAADREQFLNVLDEELRDRAAKFLSVPKSNRTELVTSWQDVFQIKGNPAEGRTIFVKRCSVCHKLENTGYEVGPNLAALTNRSSAYLLTAILDPNRDVDARYNSYVAALDDGRTVNGILISETSTALTLREQEGKEYSLLRNQIEEFRNTGRSAMPEGIERDISKQQMADLLTYLLDSGPAPRSFAGNTPQPTEITDQQEIVLPATIAAIYGEDIAFETDSPFKNIGYWHGVNDTALWTVHVNGTNSEGNRFDVWLDYSCHAASAGNTLTVNSTGDPILFEVPSTGGWDRYRFAKVGSITLPAGTHRISLYPDRSFQGPALLDLRAVILTRHGQAPAMAIASGLPSSTLETPSEIADRLLDDAVSTEDREQLIAANPQHSATLIRLMANGLGNADDEEYRRIPWIWRVAIAAGKRNNGKELLEILEVSLPRPNEPLRDWQAVVVGGGIINGISQSGVWPRERLDRLIAGNEPLSARWDHTIAQSSKMADDEQVRTGTRYDALRIIAMETFELHGRQLVKYLAMGVNDELQMGAISGLSDMPAGDAGIAITENLPHYSDYNRGLALTALLRTNARALRLLVAVESGRIPIEQIDATTRSALLSHPSPEVQQGAARLFGQSNDNSTRKTTDSPTP